MSGRTLSRNKLSQALLLWTWLVVAFGLAQGSAAPPSPSQLSRHCDSLAAPRVALEMVATPAPTKSPSVLPLFDAFIALPALGIFIADSRSVLPCPSWDDAPSFFLPAVRQSPFLPRPPPSV